MKLNVKALAVSLGLTLGLAVFGITWWIILFEGVTGEVTLIGKVYRGYTVSPLGSLIGFVSGFIDGLIGGAILGWLYNWIAGRSSKAPAH